MDYYEMKMRKSSGSYKAVFWSLVCIVVCMILLAFVGCRSIQYVPVETVRTEYKVKTDTIKMSDTIRTEKETILREVRPEDSAMIAKLGIKLQDNERLLILLRNQLTEANSKQYESHTDTVIKKDSVQVPYPVPAQLTKWQQLKVDWGGWALLGIVLISLFSIIYIIRRYRPLR